MTTLLELMERNRGGKQFLVVQFLQECVEKRHERRVRARTESTSPLLHSCLLRLKVHVVLRQHGESKAKWIVMLNAQTQCTYGASY